MERFFKAVIVHCIQAIAFTALVCAFHLFSAANDIVKRWDNEPQSGVNASSSLVAALVLAVSRCRVLSTYRDSAHPVDQKAKLHRVFCFRLSRRPRECENINERVRRLRQHEAKAPSRPASSTRPTIFDAISDIVQLAFSPSIVSRRFARRAHPFITACAAGDVHCLLALFQLELYATQLTCTYIPAPQAPSAPSAPPSNRASQNQFEPRLHAMVACLRRLSALLPAKCHRCGGAASTGF